MSQQDNTVESSALTGPVEPAGDASAGGSLANVSPHGVSAGLNTLREALSQAAASGMSDSSTRLQLDKHLAGLGQKLGLVLAEHEGMGNELLHAYEQLGVVFDVTRQLASVTTEPEVMKVFVESLSTMFRRCHFVTMHPDGNNEYQVRVWENSADAPLPKMLDGLPVGEFCSAPAEASELAKLVAEGVNARGAVVPECASAMSHRQAMVCPVFAGDDFAYALVLIRAAGFREFTSADMLLMNSLVSFCGDIVRKLRLMGELRQMSIDMVRALVETIDQKDVYTSGHSTRVGYYARLLAEGLGWPDERLQALEWAALLHDVGKIGIRDEVLKSTGKLSEAEFAHMKEHPVRSSEVVCRVPQLAEAIDGVLHHHEHWDGSGYPDGLVGEDIPLQARIIQIADIFDALTTSRSYRKAFTWQKALGILREEAGSVVDPKLSEVFEKLIRERRSADPERFDESFETSTRWVGEEDEPVVAEVGGGGT